jgi:hypothetical protein
MQTLIENTQPSYGPHCTREQARKLLEGLRAAYQSLPLHERTLFRSAISQMSREQSGTETIEENESFE